MPYGGSIPGCQPVHIAELAKKEKRNNMSGAIMNYKLFSLYRGQSVNSVAKGGIRRGLSYRTACLMRYPKVGYVQKTIFDRELSQTEGAWTEATRYDVRLQKNGRRVFTFKSPG
jgi:hypothetical protein